MLTVVETSAFARRAEKLLSVEEHEELLFYLALHPESGDEIPGTGGVRKVRFAAKGKGKSGGVRVIYYFFDEENPLYAIFSLRQKRASKSHTGSKKTGRSLCSDAQSGRKGTEDQPMKHKNVANELVEAMREAAAIAQGESQPAAVHLFPLPLDVDVRAVRAGTGLSRAEFARRFALDPRALQDWEQGRRRPDRAARAYLTVISRRPEAVVEALAS
jgi:DNA-binding transcriptional regulator YiaG/mRNA-degrading endonuclease RelE of RelBE toxin-antitoxin system